MGPVPENAVAGRTDGEAFLSQVNVRRHSFEHSVFIDFFKENVAVETAAENLGVLEAEFMNNLLDLMFVRIAFD